MSRLLDRTLSSDKMPELLDRLRKGGMVWAEGLWGSAAPLLAAAACRALDRTILYITAHIDQADQVQDDLDLLLGGSSELLPAWESLPPENLGADEIAGQRVRICSKLIRDDSAGHTTVLVAPIQALIHPVPAPKLLVHNSLSLQVGQETDIESLADWLVGHGFERLDQVEQGGDFAVRGGIVDVYPGGYEHPVRVEFFGQQIESIRRFDPLTQRSDQQLEQLYLAPLAAGGQWGPEKTCNFLEYLPPDSILIFHEPLEIAELADSFVARVPDAARLYRFGDIHLQAEKFARLNLVRFGATDTQQRLRLGFQSLPRFEHQVDQLAQQIAQLASQYHLMIFCETAGQQKRLQQFLAEHGAKDLEITFQLGLLHRGFIWSSQRLAVLTDHEIFHRYQQRHRLRKTSAAPTESFAQLDVGDYVVHVDYGIGKFEDIKLMRRHGRTEEFLTIRFADRALVHITASQINLIQKYQGGFRGHPPLSKLGSPTWSRTKKRVDRAVTSLAQEMLQIQAKRETLPGIKFPGDTEWQGEFEDSFIYQETEDQLLAMRDIKQDMESVGPMDRLLCGDVGYGKTELAARAAFKAVEAGFQVALLVPTTVLAEQHYRTFTQRMADFPFTVDVLNRFRSGSEQARIIKQTADGRIDILIGTHRLLSDDVKFANLGLVIIDEEQRFGVAHKQRLKKMRATVDVLTMTATPIPRTLHMSLVGLREISTLATPPFDRRAIHTEVQYYDSKLIRQAILRELNRDGQIYFVHNLVHNIDKVAQRIAQTVPEARIGIGHGQMPGKQLERVMLDFVRRKIDVLVCTTIIESGLDIPTANTIIINNADHFGLADLHQLRGRVGRYKYRAHAYMLIPHNRPVTPAAARRLRAIEEYSQLGAGFRIAMRDLEIRGAGNILGPEQSGHIAAVGYELYCQLLTTAVRKLKNQHESISLDTHLELGVGGYIPRSYINSDRQRMEVYRRMGQADCQADLQQLTDDLRDIFGKIPRQAQMLLDLAELKIMAGNWAIKSIILDGSDLVFTLGDLSRARNLFADAPGAVRYAEPTVVHLRPPARYLQGPTLLAVLRKILHNAP